MYVTRPKSARSPRTFVVVTRDFSGLGWAKLLQDEGETVVIATDCPETKAADKKLYDQVGQGWFDVMTLPDAMKQHTKPNTYWLFAENNCPKEADALRAKGQCVFGTSKFTDGLEHDREQAVAAAKKAGLKSPETCACGSREEGLKFLDAHPDTAYVLKPDEGTANYSTFVPVRQDDADANRETYTYLKNLTKEPGSFILQERVSGVELNAEAWYYEGMPFFAFVTLEAKRKDVGDLGEMSGCAGDLIWVVDPDDRIIQETVGKMHRIYADKKYTGFADANVIWVESRGPLFLEVCDRFGYSAHPNLFMALAKDSFGDIMADYMDGQIGDMRGRFKEGFGASLTLFLDHPVEGLPLHVDTKTYFPFDGYRTDDEEMILLAGYSTEVGIVATSAGTPKKALQQVLHMVADEEAVSFPGIYYRTDLAETGYPNAILDRVEGLKRLGLV